MDMAMSSSMDMAMTSVATGMSMSPTSTGMAAMASSTGESVSGMDMGGSCKISMLWNWNVIDTCFISSSWHVTSKGMFAGSCIGVILLVILLEFLRRAGKEYDRYIVAQHTQSLAKVDSTNPSSAASVNGNGTNKVQTATSASACGPASRSTFRPTIVQQAIRALLHMCQFAVAYFVMLLAMYYNGYMLICIFIGAYLGFFIFGWESFNVGLRGQDRMEENATVCCG